MADNKKKKIIDDVTTINSGFLQPIFGGDFSADPNSPEFNGHLHDGRNDFWGHASQIDLTKHTIGRVTLQDAYAVAKSVGAYPSIIASQGNILSGTFLNVGGTNFTSSASISPGTPGTLAGTFSASTPGDNQRGNGFSFLSVSSPINPFTLPGILSTAIWYFAVPLDIDVTKPSYFKFYWRYYYFR